MRFDGLGLSAIELIESMMEQDATKRIPLNGMWDFTFASFLRGLVSTPGQSKFPF